MWILQQILIQIFSQDLQTRNFMDYIKPYYHGKTQNQIININI